MKKFLLFVTICWMFLIIPTFAMEVKTNVPTFNVYFNGIKIENENRQFPLLVYKDITYLPMTYYDCRYFGLTTDWNNETNTFSVEKSFVTGAYREYNWEWKNANKNKAIVCDCNVIVNGEVIDNSKEEYPLLTFRDVTYFPLTWRFAVDEFGWEHSFDIEKGLIINSDNYHVEAIKLPNCTGMAATDNSYYYYNGVFEGKNVIYRVSVIDTSNPQVMHELPETDMSRIASFIECNGDIYINYFAGSSPIMATEYYYKIEADGTLTSKKPENYSGGKHGYSEFTVQNDDIFVKGVNEYFDSPTKMTYIIDGVESEAKSLPGRVRIGRKRNGLQDYNVKMHDCIKIYNDKIYYTAIDLDSDKDSDLYCIDTKTGETEKILEGVFGFHLYTGWLNVEQSDSTMIIYDSNGNIMRYDELTGKTRVVEEIAEEGMTLVAATGDYCIYTVLKTLLGDRTIVKAFADYATGYSSINGEVILDTKTGTYISNKDDKIVIHLSGEPTGEDIRLLVVDGGYITEQFCSSDVASGIFIYNDTLMYQLSDNTTVRVELKK